MYIYFCVYARHAGFVREVPNDSKRDFSSSVTVWASIQCTVIALLGVVYINKQKQKLVRGTPNARVLLHWVIISRRDGGSVIRSVIVSDPSIQIPHVKMKVLRMHFPKPQNHRPQKHPELTPFYHVYRTSSSTHSNYLCLLTLLHLILLSPFST